MNLQEFKKVSRRTKVFRAGLRLKVYELMRKGKLMTYISGTEYYNGLSPGRYVRYVIGTTTINRENFIRQISEI